MKIVLVLLALGSLGAVAAAGYHFWIQAGERENSELRVENARRLLVRVQTGAEVETTPKELIADYANNEVAADIKYRDKIVELDGVLEQVARNGDLLVAIMKPDIGCAIGGEIDNWLKVTKGQRIVMRGLSLGKPRGYSPQTLMSCVLVATYGDK